MMTLNDLQVNEKAKILSICEDSLSLKLMEMGFIPGENVVVEHQSLGDDPIAVRVSGYLIALRREEAALVCVDKQGKA
jgi:ferrous iron transport protein A